MPEALLQYPPKAGDPCLRAAPEPLAPRFRPPLAEAPVTQQGTIIKTIVEHGIQRSERLLFDPEASATAALQWRTADAIPDITLQCTFGTSVEAWSARRDLLFSNAGDRHFVLEVESDGYAQMRFGDDQHGRRPDDGTAFTASYLSATSARTRLRMPLPRKTASSMSPTRCQPAPASRRRHQQRSAATRRTLSSPRSGPLRPLTTRR